MRQNERQRSFRVSGVIFFFCKGPLGYVPSVLFLATEYSAELAAAAVRESPRPVRRRPTPARRSWRRRRGERRTSSRRSSPRRRRLAGRPRPPTSQPRRRRDSSPRNIHVAAAAPPRFVGEISIRTSRSLPSRQTTGKLVLGGSAARRRFKNRLGKSRAGGRAERPRFGRPRSASGPRRGLVNESRRPMSGFASGWGAPGRARCQKKPRGPV